MARETELGFKIKRVLSDNDQWKKIVKETEAFYDKLESNPAEINIGDTKSIVGQLRQVRAEYDKINNDTSSNHGQIEFANTLFSILSKAEDKFGAIGVMFKNVNNNTKKYVTGLTDITRYLGDSDFGVKFLDVGAQFGELQNRAEELYDTLKTIGTFSGEFSFWTGSFDKYDLQERIAVLRELKSVQEDMMDFDPSLRAGDFVTGQSVSGLDSWVEDAQKSLELLRKSGLETTRELNNLREEFTDQLDSYAWDSDSFKRTKENIDDKEFYESSLQDLRDYISGREELLNKLQSGYERNLFTDDELENMTDSLTNNLAEAKGNLKELEQFKNIGSNIDFTEVVNALQEIKDAIKEIKNAFAPLTEAFGDEESAIHAMVTSNVAQLDELVNKFKEVHEMVDQLNQKDFSIQQNTYNQTITKEDPLAKFRETKKEAKALYDEVFELWQLSAAFNKESKKDRSTSVYLEDTFGKTYTEGASTIGGFALQLGRLNQVVTKGKKDEIESAIVEMNKFKEVAIQFLEIQNRLQPGSFDASKYSTKVSAASKDVSGAAEKAESTTESAVNSIQDDVQKLEEVRAQILETVNSIQNDLSSIVTFENLQPNYAAIQTVADNIYNIFDELQTKIKALDFNIEVPTDGINQITQVIAQEGKSAEDAVPKKNAFTEANKKVAASMQSTGEAGADAVSGIKQEAEAVEEATKTLSNIDGISIDANKIAEQYKKSGRKWDELSRSTLESRSKLIAKSFNNYISTAGIKVSDIDTSFLDKSYKADDGSTALYEVVKLVAKGTNALGEVVTITKEYNMASAALEKETTKFHNAINRFDLATAKSTADSQVKELKNQMGSFKIDLSDLETAQVGIVDEKSFDVFNEKLKNAKQRIAEIKGMLKSSRSLDPIVNAESTMSNLKTTVDTYRENIKKFLDVEGFDKLEASLDAIATKLKEFEANQAFGGDGKDMASIVADINKEITTYNANLKLVTSRYQENTRVANEAAKAEKQRIAEQNAAETKAVQQNKLELNIERQTGLLTKQQARWEAMGILTDELKEKINSMFDALAQVTDSNGLSAWKTQWEMVKDQVAETQYQIEAVNKAQNEKASEKKAARAYWDEEFNYSLKNLITPEKRPELEQLKVSMLRQAEMTKESVMEQYDAIMTIISNKNKALSKLMSSKGPEEQKYWQDQYSSWFGAWNALDSNVISNFFNDVSNQAILGAKNVEKFNIAIEESKQLAAKQQDQTLKAQEDAQAKALKSSVKAQEAATREAARKQNFDLDIERQTTLLTKQQAQWEKNGQLTDELRLNIELMFEALTEVTNSAELSAWKKQWTIIKDEVMATKYQIEATNKAQKEANSATAAERKASGAYWDSAFKESLDNLITPQKRPELEQLKMSMLAQAETTKESVIEQYNAIMTIISSKNAALQKLMAAKGPSEKQYWQDEYSAWFGAWNNLDQNVVSNFFKDAGNQAILGKDKVESFNNELEKSTQLANKQKDIEYNKKSKEQEKINKQNQNYGKTEYNKYAKFYENMNATIRNIEQNGNINQYLDSLVQKYTEAYKKIEAIRKQFAENPDAANDIGLKNDFQDAVVEAEKLRKEINGVFNEAKKFDQVDPIKISTLEEYGLDDIKSSLIAFANEAVEGKLKLEGFNDAGTQLYGTLDRGNGSIEKVTFALREGTNQLYAYSAATGKAANEWEDFKAKAVAGAKNLIGMYVGFQEGVQAFRTGVNYVKEIDLAMTELKKVTDETDASYKQFLKDAASTSSVIGSTISDFTEATANFARLGYSMEESASMAETAIIYKNVADGLDTVEESTESIISTMKAFGIEANNTMSIIDKYNEVGNNFAITSAGIGEALQRSASALFEAGNTIDESIALVTAANSVIQNPEQVGTALKTLALRLRGTKTELQEAGEDTDGMAESVSQLQAKLLALTHGKVNIMIDANNFKSTTQVLREMASAWQDMTDIERASALELMGGKRQACKIA